MWPQASVQERLGTGDRSAVTVTGGRWEPQSWCLSPGARSAWLVTMGIPRERLGPAKRCTVLGVRHGHLRALTLSPRIVAPPPRFHVPTRLCLQHCISANHHFSLSCLCPLSAFESCVFSVLYTSLSPGTGRVVGLAWVCLDLGDDAGAAQRVSVPLQAGWGSQDPYLGGRPAGLWAGALTLCRWPPCSGLRP